MKIINGIFAALILMAAIACSTDAEKVLPKKDGKWALNKLTIATSQTVAGQTNTTNSVFTSGLGTYTFDKDGSGSYVSSDTTLNFKWSGSEDKLTFTYTDNSTESITVQESSKDAQKWYYSETSTYTLGTETVTQTINQTMELTRQ